MRITSRASADLESVTVMGVGAAIGRPSSARRTGAQKPIRRATCPVAQRMTCLPHPRFARSSVQTGFTMLELLVVVSVIAILVGMLLPAIRSIRSAAASTVCLANMRQINLGIIGYSGEWKGRIPLNYNGVPGGNATGNLNAWAENWGTTIAVYLEMRVGRYPYGDVQEPFADHRRANIFNCPENRVQHWQMGTHQGEDATSYAGNGWGDISMPFEAPWGSLYFGAPVRRIAHPDQLMAFWDGLYYMTECYMDDGAGAVPYTGIGTRLVTYRHRGKANVMYADGHTQRSSLIRGHGDFTGVAVTTPMRAASWSNGAAWWALE